MLGQPSYRTKERFIGIKFGQYGWRLYGNGVWRPELTKQEVDEIWEAWLRSPICG